MQEVINMIMYTNTSERTEFLVIFFFTIVDLKSHKDEKDISNIVFNVY